MNILIIHQSFPGQFKNLLPLLKSLGHKIVAVGARMDDEYKKFLHGQYIYTPKQGTTFTAFPLVHEIETKTIRGYYAYEGFVKIKESNFNPDIIIVHPGWGESFFLRHVWPDSFIVSFQEFYYQLKNSDLDYDSDYSNNLGLSRLRLELKNSHLLHSLTQSDLCLSPTKWQTSRFPKIFQDKFRTIHEGIDLEYLNSQYKLALQKPRFDERPYITYMARHLEPYRGYHKLIEIMPYILEECGQDLQIYIIGEAEGSGYGSIPDGFKGWKEFFEQHKPLKRAHKQRVHFLGTVKYEKYIHICSNSLAHFYISYPFVLSWSVLELMFMKIPIIANKIDMNAEVISHQESGMLFDYNKPYDAVSCLKELIKNPHLAKKIGDNARKLITSKYDSKNTSKEIWNEILKAYNSEPN